MTRDDVLIYLIIIYHWLSELVIASLQNYAKLNIVLNKLTHRNFTKVCPDDTITYPISIYLHDM